MEQQEQQYTKTIQTTIPKLYQQYQNYNNNIHHHYIRNYISQTYTCQHALYVRRQVGLTAPCVGHRVLYCLIRR